MNSAMRVVALALLLGSAIAHADDYGADSGDDSKTQNQLAAAAAIARGNWAAAAPLLEAHIAGHSDDDEAVAELGHVYAHLGDTEMALQLLKSALWMNPRSLEANLYLGEFYVGQKDRVHALERLAALDRICIFGCGEYRTLKKAIASMGVPAR
ncbi:MAG: tetratricopeptide repeat protein [Comamonadaceae bacterium]